ncbi:hypothetical protein HMPREF1987_00271 [Peptostreptococcaceae bacterium oral taxon 113 str. W5053]|nr:hypothetical protein HMPREF1987_00271 [Peptostreptococcaceae bacterium oral taxon 113 str. W5053]
MILICNLFFRQIADNIYGGFGICRCFEVLLFVLRKKKMKKFLCQKRITLVSEDKEIVKIYKISLRKEKHGKRMDKNILFFVDFL